MRPWGALRRTLELELELAYLSRSHAPKYLLATSTSPACPWTESCFTLVLVALFELEERTGGIMAAGAVDEVRDSNLPPLAEERASEQAEKAHVREEDTSRHVRTQLLRRVAHDIASPAGVTLTVLDELMSEGMQRPELLVMARRSLRRLMRLSEHLALAAELETESLEPELTTLDIRGLAKQALDDALAIDGRRDVVATCDLAAASLLIDGDARLLLATFREIVGNALRIASSRVEVRVKADDTSVVFRVDDDGPGFSADAMQTLGRRFERRSTSHGLGLSLSMATDILRAHGGRLHVEPSTLPPGRRGLVGAAVIISLPPSGAASGPR